MQLSIARTLVVIFVAMLALSVVAISTFGQWVEDRTVGALAATQSRRDAELIFQNLYSVMRKGWTKDEIAELVERVNQTQPDIHVAVYRSQQVADMYGEIARDADARNLDPLIGTAMESGMEQLTVEGDTLRFIYPVRMTEECVSCHTGAPGSINGVIDIRFPSEKLKAPLRFTLRALNWSFAAVIGLLFVLVLLKLRFLVARPISDLADHIDGILVSGNLDIRVEGRQFTFLSEVRSLAHNFNRLLGQLESSRRELVRQSVTDPLTGLANRRHFDAVCSQEVARARRHGHPLAVIMIDLDGFKPINDRLGHAAGDAVLRAVAEVLAANVRVTDTAARLGGDEFAVLAAETDDAGARFLTQKLENAIAATKVPIEGMLVSVEASIGMAMMPKDGDTIAAALEHADQAMYAAKQARKARAQPKLKAV